MNTLVSMGLLWPAGVHSGYLFTSISWISPNSSSCSTLFQKAAAERVAGFNFLTVRLDAIEFPIWTLALKFNAAIEMLPIFMWNILKPDIFKAWNKKEYELEWNHGMVKVICNLFFSPFGNFTIITHHFCQNCIVLLLHRNKKKVPQLKKKKNSTTVIPKRYCIGTVISTGITVVFLYLHGTGIYCREWMNEWMNE